jgi:hypothetical protein
MTDEIIDAELRDALAPLIARGRALRAILDEIVAEGSRLKEACDSRYQAELTLLAALRQNPCGETAQAFVDHLRATDDLGRDDGLYDGLYAQREALAKRRRLVRSQLIELGADVLTTLGIAVNPDTDYPTQ